MKTFSLIIYIFISNSIYSQTEIKSLCPNVNNNDLVKLDSVFNSKKLIGLGEGTHGSSEFTIIRFRLFKYLVKNLGYDTFFIEADYGACLRINYYINGSDDKIEEAIKEINLYPFMTSELIEIIEWMRFYNLINKKKLNLVGVDMQFLTDDKIAFNRIFSSNKNINPEIKKFVSLLYNEETQNQLKELKNSFEKILNTKIQVESNKEYIPLLNSVQQYLLYKIDSKYSNKHNIRDSCMAYNMINYLSSHSNSKGIFFAHNEHCSKIYFKNNNFELKRSGYYLEEKYKDKYISIAILFDEGSFLSKKKTKKGYVFKVFKVNKAKRGTVETSLRKYNFDYCIQDASKIELRKYNHSSIGAVYNQNYFRKHYHQYYNYKQLEHDYFIYIKNSNPILLIK